MNKWNEINFVKVDTKGRIALGKGRLFTPKFYKVSQNDKGQLLLEPMVLIRKIFKQGRNP